MAPLFTFKTLRGSTSGFHVKNTAIVTREFAEKYFGPEEALGKQLSVILNDTTLIDLSIGCILDRIPKNSSFQFTIIIPFDHAYSLFNSDPSAWTMQVPTVTYVRLDPAADPKLLLPGLDSYARKNNEILRDWQVRDFYLIPFKIQKKETQILYSAITCPGLPDSALYGTLFLNTVILLIACFNFTNTALAFGRRRLKEIGLRKIFGGAKRQIIIQFMTENLIQCFIALFLAMYIASLWIEWMNIQWSIDLKSDYAGNPQLILMLLVLLFGVTLIAGAYPSFYVARFAPSRILKGDLKFSGTNLITRILLTLQFGFSVLAVYSTVVLYMNAQYQTRLDWGYDKESVIVVPMHDENKLEVYKNAALAIPGIRNLAGTIHNAGFGHQDMNVEINGQPYQTEVLLTGDRYIKTMGMEILQGRDFIPGSDNDRKESILVNRKFLEDFNIKDPLSQAIKIEKQVYYIVGVVKDFMPYGLLTPVNPVIIRLTPDRDCTLLCVQADPSQLKAVYSSLGDQWKLLFPNKPYEGYYQGVAAGYARNINHGILVQFALLGIFALILSTIGLYSMVALSVNKRVKEIGIRKVLGASTGQIMKLVNREFIIILLIACSIGTFMGYSFMNKFLGDIFKYHLNIGFPSFIISVGLILVTAFSTSGRKIYRASQTDPARSLRYE